MHETFMNKLKKLAVNVRDFFWWSAGIVPSVLEKCPTNHAKYTAIGVIMIFIALLASCSFAFFLGQTFAIPFVLALPGGALWGILIYSLDRVVLTSFRKDDTSKISIIQRYILTVSLALIIGEPLLMQLFSKEIAFEMAQNGQTVSSVSRQKATERFQAEIDLLDTANNNLETRLETLKTDRDAKEKAVIGETEGSVGSGKKGFGEAAKLKEKAFQEADAKYKEFKTEAAQTFSENKTRLAEIRTEIQTETKKIATANAEADGVLAKHEALFNIVKTQPGAALIYIPLFFGLLFLETLPLSIKVFGKKSVFDAALETEESETIENFETEKTRRQNRQNAIEDRISEAIADDKIADLRDQSEQKVAKNIKAEILRSMAAKAFNRQKAENSTVGFGEEIAVEVVGYDDLQIKLQLPENARREISLQELSGDIETIAGEIGAAENVDVRVKLKKAFSSKGHEIWEDLPLLPQLERDQKLVLQFEEFTTI